jgi:cytochrome c oxidase subunit 2
MRAPPIIRTTCSTSTTPWCAGATKIRFVITADDVIHAWWVPALGWKQDAIPGIVNEAWPKSRAGRLPRPVRRAVRQGPRLHADRRARAAEGRIHTAWLAEQKAKNAPAAAPAAPAPG